MTALLTDPDTVAALLGNDGYVRDTAMCSCGHRCASHSSYDLADAPVAVGAGICGFYSCDCPAFTPTGSYSIKPIYPDREAEDAAFEAWRGRRQLAGYWLRPETVMSADRAARVREQYRNGAAPQWLYGDAATIRRLTT